MITRSLSRSLQRPLPANECREEQGEEESFAPTVDNLLTGATFWLVAALWFVLALDVSAWHASLLATVVQSTWLVSYHLCNDSGFLLKITRAIPDRKLLFNFVAILYIVIVPSCVLGCAFTKALSTRYLCLAVWTFCLGTLFNLVRLGKFVEFPSRSPAGSSLDQSSPLKRFVVTTYSGHQASSKRNSLTEAPLTVANVSIFLLTHHLGIFTCFHFGFQLGLPVLTTLILPMFGAASWLLTQDKSPRTFK
jgi:hypothetical protein